MVVVAVVVVAVAVIGGAVAVVKAVVVTVAALVVAAAFSVAAAAVGVGVMRPDTKPVATALAIRNTFADHSRRRGGTELVCS